MSLKFSDYLNRTPLVVATMATLISMVAFGLIIKVYKLNSIESLPALPMIALFYYFIHELKYCMDLQLSENGIVYLGKRSKWFKFRPETKMYIWDEVSSIAFNNGFRIITINFSNGDKIRFSAEPDKTQSFYDTVKLYCSDKVASQEELAAYLDQIPTMASEYNNSLFRGLSIGLPILFIGIAVLLFFALFIAIKQTP